MILAVDVGGTKIKIGLVESGSVLSRTSIDAHSDIGLAQALPRIVVASDELLSAHGREFTDVSAIGVSFPSLIDIKTGRVLFGYGKFMDAMDIDLKAWSSDTLNLPLYIENDARVAMLGEWKAGAGIGSDNLVMITLGTGIGVSALIEGQVLRGVHGQAGILGGHISIDPNGHRCNCGGRGCAEAEASTSVVDKQAREHPDFYRSQLARVSEIDYQQVFNAARNGDLLATHLSNRAIEVWSTLIINLIHAYDPERVIVGGGIAAGWDDFMPEVIERVQQNVHTPWGKVSIVPAMLGNDAALVGCEALIPS
jgi:glucokinase